LPCAESWNIALCTSHEFNETIYLRAAKALADEHVAQILGCLRSSRVEHGLLINFGAPKFEIKKYVLSRIGEGAARAD
jgi:hypothetical protein